MHPQFCPAPGVGAVLGAFVLPSFDSRLARHCALRRWIGTRRVSDTAAHCPRRLPGRPCSMMCTMLFNIITRMNLLFLEEEKFGP